MITDNKVLEVHYRIIKILAEQGIDTLFAVVDGMHQCCLKFDNRVLFEDSNYIALPYVFKQWCDDFSTSAVGKRIMPF